MAKLVSKKPHYAKPSGYVLEFDNGHIYSLVNLGEPVMVDEEEPSIRVEAWKNIGKMYDKMGGRYEAILLPESNESGEWGSPIRAHDFETLIGIVKKVEEDNG